MLVHKGDLVKMRDGRTVLVSDAADQGQDGLVPAGYDGEGMMPAESIFVGNTIKNPTKVLDENNQIKISGDLGRTVVSDMSEVASVLFP